MANGRHWKEETLKALEGQPDSVKAQLTRAIKERQKAKLMEDEAKELKNKANKTAMGILVATGIKKVVSEEFGQMIYTEGERESLDKDRVKQLLVEAGVEAGVVEFAFSQATKKTKYEQVTYRVK